MKLSLSITLLAFSLTAWCASPIILNGTAATVGNRLVTIQDARFYRALQRFREGESDVFRAEEGEELRRTVQKLVLDEMVFAEMKSFQFEAGNRAEAEKNLRAERSKGKSREGVWKEFLLRFGKTEAVAVDRLHKTLQVDKFLQKKVETLTPIVTEAEAERYFQQNQSRFYGNTFDHLKPSIILRLKKERMQKGLEEWVKFLEDKYGVNNLLEG